MQALKAKCLCGAEGLAIKDTTEFVFACRKCRLLVYGSYRVGMSFPFVVLNGRELDACKDVSKWALDLLKSSGEDFGKLLEVMQ